MHSGMHESACRFASVCADCMGNKFFARDCGEYVDLQRGSITFMHTYLISCMSRENVVAVSESNVIYIYACVTREIYANYANM